MMQAAPTIANFFLTGFTACGKTSVGQRLAKLAKMDFVDLDERLQQRSQKPIPILFQELGEECYRFLETEILKELAQKNGQVIALGAGTILVPLNRELVQQHGMVVFLDLPSDELFERIRLSDKRILFQLPADVTPLEDAMLYRRVQVLYELRRPYYQTADIVVPVSRMTLDQVVQEILFSLQKFRTFPAETL